MQLMVDIPSRSSNQNLADEQLSNEILEEIRAMEMGQLQSVETASSSQPVEGYTDLAECSTGSVHNYNMHINYYILVVLIL